MSSQKANLDAWHVLRTVIDVGGFAQAADRLQRSQSAISYSISKLQEQVGLELLTTKGRRAVLTQNGALLLERSRALLVDYDNILQLAKSLRKGYESALSVWIDGLCPVGFLKPVLGEFQTHYPQTPVSLIQGGMGGGIDDKRNASPGQVDLAITTRPLWETSFDNLGELSFIAVVHPNHPILGCDPPVSSSVLRKHRQVSLWQANKDIASEEQSDQNTSNWLVSSYHQAIEAVLMGQAYGWLPKRRIEKELAEGKLKRLVLEQGGHYRLPVYLQYNPQRPSGQARQALGGLISRYLAPYL